MHLGAIPFTRPIHIADQGAPGRLTLGTLARAIAGAEGTAVDAVSSAAAALGEASWWSQFAPVRPGVLYDLLEPLILPLLRAAVLRVPPEPPNAATLPTV